jgi:hypothetical protein
MFMHKIRNKTHHLNKLDFIKKKATKEKPQRRSHKGEATTKGKTTTLLTTFI